MGDVNKAFELILQYKGYFQRFADAEAALLDAARLEGAIEQMKRDLPGIKAEYDAALAAKDEMKRERDQKMAIHKETIINARAAAKRAEADRDAKIANAEASLAEARQALAAEVSAFRVKAEAEMAELGKQVAAMRAERDSIERALSELKRLAAR